MDPGFSRHSRHRKNSRSALALVVTGAGWLLWFTPKTPATVLVVGLVAFGLSAYLIWHLKWIEKSIYRRISAVLICATFISATGWAFWPQPEQNGFQVGDKELCTQAIQLASQFRNFQVRMDSEFRQNSSKDGLGPAMERIQREARPLMDQAVLLNNRMARKFPKGLDWNIELPDMGSRSAREQLTHGVFAGAFAADNIAGYLEKLAAIFRCQKTE